MTREIFASGFGWADYEGKIVEISCAALGLYWRQKAKDIVQLAYDLSSPTIAGMKK